MDEFEAAIRRRVEEVAGPIFEAALHRKQKNCGSDRLSITSLDISLLWRPNNYRREMTYKSAADRPLKTVGGVYPGCRVSRKSIIEIRDYPHLLVQIGPRKVTAYWMQLQFGRAKQTFLIRRSSFPEIVDAVMQKVVSIQAEADAALDDVARRLGLCEVGARRWAHHEDWARDEEFIARLPVQAIFYDENVKKVYAGDVGGLEFTGGNPGESMLTYLQERHLGKVSPQICARLGALDRRLASIERRLDSLERPHPLPVHKCQQRLQVSS